MSLPILPIAPRAVPALIAAPAVLPAVSPAFIPATGGSGPAFSAVFTDAISKVEAFQQNAQQSVNRFLSGEGEDLHKVALASQEADLSFQLFLQVRNKVVSAYQEVMRMQV
jgi:flagellar hook-basal body complex protein FliE